MRQLASRRFALLVSAAALAVLALVVFEQARPAGADHVQIVVSFSNVEPAPAPQQLALYPGGPPITLHVWAKDAHDLTGIGAFNIGFNYASGALTVSSVQLQTAWLRSTGRVALCPPAVVEPNPGSGAGRVLAGCSTIGTPAGAQGTGLLASITFQPKASGFPTLDFSPETFLISRGSTTGGVRPPAVVASSLPPPFTIVVARCGDFDGNGVVSIHDVLNVAQRFSTAPGMPNWNPVYDLNQSNAIEVTDILLTARQFSRRCTI